MNRFPLAAAAVGALLLLTGCAAASPAPADDQNSASDEVVNAPTEVVSDESDHSDALAHITGCDVVEALVQPYIQGLVADPSNVVDEWGVTCSWVMADDETDWENNRAVEVGIAPEPATEKPDVAALAKMAGYDVVPLDDAWVTAEGGVAYTITMTTSVSGATVTKVWLPYAEVDISGGTWGDIPALDGPAAIEIARGLLG